MQNSTTVAAWCTKAPDETLELARRILAANGGHRYFVTRVYRDLKIAEMRRAGAKVVNICMALNTSARTVTRASHRVTAWATTDRLADEVTPALS